MVSTDGVLWMGLSDDQLLYLATARSITLWSLNYFFSFWSTAHNAVTSLSLVGSANKTTRVVATSSDSRYGTLSLLQNHESRCHQQRQQVRDTFIVTPGHKVRTRQELGTILITVDQTECVKMARYLGYFISYTRSSA